MVKKTKYNEIIQKVLDQCKKWSGDDRVGRFYQISQFPFVKEDNYSDIECQVLYDMVISSELFDEYDKNTTDYKNGLIKLNKEGYKCVSYHKWNYEKYLSSKKIEKRDVYFKLLIVVAGIAIGIIATITTEYIKKHINHPQEPQIEVQVECSHDIECEKANCCTIE